MSDQNSRPLNEAQKLVSELQEQAKTLGSEASQSILSGLSRLGTLLQQAVVAGEGEDAASLRQTVTDMIAQTASFNSMMVHEIRKPMTSIRGYSDMLAKPELNLAPEMKQQFIDTIRTNIIRMEGLVTDISDMNKLTSGRMKLDDKMTTFGQVIMEVQKTVEPLIAEFEQNVTWEIPQGLPILNRDNKLLAKVVINLVKNAIQYTPKGGNITVKAERLEGNILRVTVTDNGIGMKEEEIARLGEPFYRADHELVTTQKGYGLGIPIAKGFLGLMGSELRCTSEPEKGSTFSFDLAGMG
jgi:signal transduction histidine kinase